MGSPISKLAMPDLAFKDEVAKRFLSPYAPLTPPPGGGATAQDWGGSGGGGFNVPTCACRPGTLVGDVFSVSMLVMKRNGMPARAHNRLQFFYNGMRRVYPPPLSFIIISHLLGRIATDLTTHTPSIDR